MNLLDYQNRTRRKMPYKEAANMQARALDITIISKGNHSDNQTKLSSNGFNKRGLFNNVPKYPVSAHHFSPDACSIDVEESEVGTCSGGVEAQEYDLGLDEVGLHWITFLQNPNHALQLGTW